MLRPRDLRRSSGTQTFLEAMYGGKVHLARFVLDALDRRIVNTPAGEQGRPPLMHAVCLREAELRSRFVRLLLDKGADVNGQDEAGRTALSLACELGHLDAVKLLVQHSADPEIPDRVGNRALMYAASCGHSDELIFLLRSYKRFGLRLDATNRAGVSALDAARVSGHWECERALSVHSPEPRRGGEPLRSPKPLSRQMLERFARPFSQRRDEGIRDMIILRSSSSCSSAHPDAQDGWRQRETLGVPEPGIQRAHSWDGPVRGGSPTAQCSRLLRRVTSPDFCQGLANYTGDLRKNRRDSICSRSQLILPSNRQALAL
ncbi:PREDICTED: ankyrin repeat domain-containing protein 63 [Nanorana parkeri]|uniref:ankyrin repeat domain-containing protein 63 n=1 Tax=Nanorana parkeri TaxID=125878 RepID=UPI0008549349|nr:PREDICTED: ankyrin repeat domain-containing protein 63 [Nanorana parkeri]